MIDIYEHTFIDLFAGGGGFSLGFMQAGFKCVAALEYAPEAAATYWHNLCMKGWSHMWLDQEDEDRIKRVHRFSSGGETHNKFFPHPPGNDWLLDEAVSPCLNLFCMDITKLEPEQFMEMAGIEPGRVSVVVGGPPCQGFSTSGDRKVDDKRNLLALRFLYYVSVIRPKMFLIENVPGILTLGKKPGDTEGPFPKWIRERALEYGYIVEYDTHNAANFGVPQNRNRVLFHGQREDLYKPEKSLHVNLKPTHTWGYFGETKRDNYMEDYRVDIYERSEGEPYVSVYEAIGDLGNIHLSSYQDASAKKFPAGHRNRVNSSSDGDNVVEFEGRYHYKDRFNGLYGHSNSIHDYGTKSAIMEDRMGDHIMCDCGKFNLHVRKKCWSCGVSLSPIILLNDI